MKIICIYERWSEIPKEISDTTSIYNKKCDFHVVAGAEYIVYGITLRDGHIWYYICDKLFTYYPIWKPSPLFKVNDSRLSRYWIYSYEKLENYSQAHPIITFSEWATNHPDFYDKLTDGEDREVTIFKAYKELMDLEFPDSSISEAAQIGDGEWLICPTCIDAWQCCNNTDALVRCPKCQKKLNNPRYRNECPHL